MRRIDYIVIHCAATRPSQDVGVAEIRRWHKDGNGWSDVGYHRIIRRNGAVEKGRPDAEAGAHVAGYNSNSYGICLVGGVDDNLKPQNNFTVEQWHSLEKLVREAQRAYGIPVERIFGHRDMPAKAGVPLEKIIKGGGFAKVSKTCPCFDVRKWVDETIRSS